MDVHRPPNAPAGVPAAGLGDLFPHEPAVESEDSSSEWLSIYLEDCLSNPVSADQADAKPRLPHSSSSNPRRKKRSLASVIRESDEEHCFTVFVESPLLLDQKDWLAESELILPKKEKDQELVQQQEQEHAEENKLYMTAVTQFQQEQVVRRCSICLFNQAPQWQGSMALCNACSLRLKAGNGFISMERCDNKSTEQDQGRGQDKRRIKKTTHFGDDDEVPQEKRRIKKAAPVDEELQQAKRKIKKATYVNEELPHEEPVKRCTHCMSFKTPQWRTGPLGPKSLCNACGVRYKSGRLLPEYRPANSPTYVSFMHSNSHKKVMQMRKSVDEM